MRDLQQAFVGDPGDFEAPPEAVPPEQRSKINLSNLKFDPKLKDPTFLDLLRGGSGADQGGGRGFLVIAPCANSGVLGHSQCFRPRPRRLGGHSRGVRLVRVQRAYGRQTVSLLKVHQK